MYNDEGNVLSLQGDEHIDVVNKNQLSLDLLTDVQ